MFERLQEGQQLRISEQGNVKLFLGGDNHTDSSCDVEFAIADLAFFDRALQDYEIAASAGTPFGIVPIGYFHLGCRGCSFDQAQRSCADGYELCGQFDIYGGVWQAAYIMGWVRFTYLDSPID